MKNIKVNILYFSPTGTSLKIIDKILEGLGQNSAKYINIKDISEEGITLPAADLTLIGVPVYSGRVPVFAMGKLKKISGCTGPVILLAVYGNRHYDDCLLELKDFAESAGFKVIGAGAFIGEHSFSNRDYPIAASRPDAEDFKAAEAFAMSVRVVIDKGRKENLSPQIPGNRPYRELKPGKPLAPVTDHKTCTMCGKCIEACPTNAVYSEDGINTFAEKCIKCCACIKVCPVNAREFNDPVIKGIREMLFTNCSERREPEIYI